MLLITDNSNYFGERFRSTVKNTFSTVADVQYWGGTSLLLGIPVAVYWSLSSTVRDIITTLELKGYHQLSLQYGGGCSVLWGTSSLLLGIPVAVYWSLSSTVRDIISTLELKGYHQLFR